MKPSRTIVLGIDEFVCMEMGGLAWIRCCWKIYPRYRSGEPTRRAGPLRAPFLKRGLGSSLRIWKFCSWDDIRQIPSNIPFQGYLFWKALTSNRPVLIYSKTCAALNLRPCLDSGLLVGIETFIPPKSVWWFKVGTEELWAEVEEYFNEWPARSCLLLILESCMRLILWRSRDQEEFLSFSSSFWDSTPFWRCTTEVWLLVTSVTLRPS